MNDKDREMVNNVKVDDILHSTLPKGAQKKVKSLIVEKSEMNFVKKDTKTIIKEAKTIDANKVAEETLTWLINNVEYFIDNTTRMFKINLILDNEAKPIEGMEQTKKLQDLFRAIPEDQADNYDNVISAKSTLNEVVSKAFNVINDRKDLLENLFTRMAFYFELKGVNKGKFLIQNLTGAVAVTNFEYEDFSVGVKINQPTKNEEDKEKYITLKEYTIPEGFTIWLEIAFRNDTEAQNIF